MVKAKNLPFFKQVLHDLFLEYKAKLRLNKDWTIVTCVEQEKHTYGEVVYDYNNRKFIVKINNEINKTVRSLKDSIIHEFWHILLCPLTNRFENTLDKIEQGKKIDVKRLRKTIENEEERLVRKFTRIIMDIERQNAKNNKKK